jgi:hypothetical protein
MSSEAYLLVTTSNSLLLIETRNGLGYRLDTGRHHYYGVTRKLGGYFVGVRYRPNTSVTSKAQESGKILHFDQSMRFVDEISPPFPMRDIHQILVHDNKLWVTCSYDNMIAVFDGNDWDAWYPLGTPQQEPFDINHFNSVVGFGNELCVVAHNLSRSTGKPSELLFFKLPEKVLIRRLSLGSSAHNVWLHNGSLMTCSSGEGRLLSVNGCTVETGGFPRGVAYLQREICIGISEFASRPDRDLGRGWIKIFDPYWNLCRTIEITEEGMVTDLLAVSLVEAERILSARNMSSIKYGFSVFPTLNR